MEWTAPVILTGGKHLPAKPLLNDALTAFDEALRAEILPVAQNDEVMVTMAPGVGSMTTGGDRSL